MDLYELAVRFKSEGFRAVSRDMDTLDKKGKGISKAFGALKASLVVGAVGGFLQKMAKESIEAQKQAAQLNAVLKSTGGIAGITAGEIDEMAGSLQRTTVFSDDAVKSAASLLLTFTNIRGEVFKNTLPAILDLSQAMGQDLKTSTVQLGKALNDPIKGIAALQRVGIQFSQSQRDVIKSLVETNRLAEAQGVILKELNVQFGGSAAAARNTLGGALEGLKNSWGDLFEVTTDGTKGVVGAINRLSDALERNKEKWQGWASSILDPSGGAVPVLSSIVRFMNTIVELQNKIGAWLHGGAGMGRGGGAGGGRDTPTGPLSLPGAVVWGQPPAPPLSSGGGTGKDKRIDLPGGQGVDIDFGGLRQFEPQEPEFDWTTSAESEAWKKFWEKQDEIKEAFAKWNEDLKQSVQQQTNKLAADLGNIIQSGLAQTLGDAIYNAFSSAFSGEGIGSVIAAFGKTILASLGSIFTQMGQTYIEYGILMTGLGQLLYNPFTSGPAAIAIGAALVALGAAIGATASRGGGAGRGTARAGAFRERSTADDITRFKFISRDGSLVNGLMPIRPIHFTVIGERDPVAQGQIVRLIKNAERRNG